MLDISNKSLMYCNWLFQVEADIDAKLLAKAKADFNSGATPSPSSSVASNKRAPAKTPAKKTTGPAAQPETAASGKGKPPPSKKKTISEMSSATASEVQVMDDTEIDTVELERLIKDSIRKGMKDVLSKWN